MENPLTPPTTKLQSSIEELLKGKGVSTHREGKAVAFRVKGEHIQSWLQEVNWGGLLIAAFVLIAVMSYIGTVVFVQILAQELMQGKPPELIKEVADSMIDRFLCTEVILMVGLILGFATPHQAQRRAYFIVDAVLGSFIAASWAAQVDYYIYHKISWFVEIYLTTLSSYGLFGGAMSLLFIFKFMRQRTVENVLETSLSFRERLTIRFRVWDLRSTISLPSHIENRLPKRVGNTIPTAKSKPFAPPTNAPKPFIPVPVHNPQSGDSQNVSEDEIELKVPLIAPTPRRNGISRARRTEPLEERTCKNTDCSTTFIPSRKDKVFCSNTCKNAFNARK